MSTRRPATVTNACRRSLGFGDRSSKTVAFPVPVGVSTRTHASLADTDQPQPSAVATVIRAIPRQPQTLPTNPTPPQRIPDPPPAAADIIVEGTREPGEGPDVATAQLLDRAQINSQPGLRDDAFRSAARLPGITMNGLSAAPHVRGGAEDEVLALLDGFPIRQPYHLSGYQNVFSLIDPQVISSMEVFTGGFPTTPGAFRTASSSDRPGRPSPTSPAQPPASWPR